MLTKKHFIELADIIRRTRSQCPPDCGPQYRGGYHDATGRLESALTAWLYTQNPRYNADRFRNACCPREDRT